MLKRAGWRDEGVGWYSLAQGDAAATPVRREYNPYEFAHNHNYTDSSDEHSMLIKAGWRDEGIGWYGVKEEIVASGAFGQGCSWKLDKDGTVTVFPTNGVSGTMGKLADAVLAKVAEPHAKSVLIDKGVKAPQDSTRLFCTGPGSPAPGAPYGSFWVDTFDVACLDTSTVKNMSWMFYYQGRVSKIYGLDFFDTSRVTSMQGMFRDCHNLTDYSGLTSWNVASVKDMSCMFEECYKLTNLQPLRKWNVSNVTDASYIFDGCCYLKSLAGLELWDTSSITNLNYAFCDCNSVKDLSPLRRWNLSKLNSCEKMFYCCYELSDLSPVSSWDVHSVRDFTQMFSRTAIKDARILNGWKVSNAETIGMFDGDVATPSWYHE